MLVLLTLVLLALDWPMLADQTTVGTFVLDILMAVIIVWGAMKGLPRVFNHAAVLAERNRLRTENKFLHETITAQSQALAAFQAVRTELDRLKDRLDELEDLQIDAVGLIASLIQHIRAGGTADTMPSIPDSLRAEVLEALRSSRRPRTTATEAL